MFSVANMISMNFLNICNKTGIKKIHLCLFHFRCQDEIAQLVEDQHIAFAEGISAEEKPSIQECMVTWTKM